MAGRMVWPLQKWHKVEIGISRAAEGKAGKFFVGDMSDDHALQLASKVVSEGFVFGVSQSLCVQCYSAHIFLTAGPCLLKLKSHT